MIGKFKGTDASLNVDESYDVPHVCILKSRRGDKRLWLGRAKSQLVNTCLVPSYLAPSFNM